MRPSHWKVAETLLSAAVLLLLVSRPGAAVPTSVTIWAAILALVLDQGRTAFPHYGSLSAGPALLLAASATSQPDFRWSALGLLLLFASRRRPEADLVPATFCLGAMALAPSTIPIAGVLFLISSALYPLMRSAVFPDLPGSFVYRALPFFLGQAAVISLGATLRAPKDLAIPFLVLCAIVGLARGQRGLNLQTAYEQESQRFAAEQSKSWLDLLEALSYSLHESADPARLRSELYQTMARLSHAESRALAERDGESWRLVERDGLDDQVARQGFADIKRTRIAPISARLKAGWDGEAHAVLIPWQNEALLYLGRRTQPLEALAQIERLGRLGAAAIRTAREKAQRRKLSERGKVLEDWIASLTSLLREIHFVGSTLERDDLLRRLKATLGRSIRPDVAYVYSGQKVECAWGAGHEAAPPSPTSLSEQAVEVPPPSGFQTAICTRLASGSLLLLFRESPASVANACVYASVLADAVGTFLSNSELYERLRQTHQALETSQDQLLRAKKLAAVGQLAAGVAHEINNPLLAISVNLELIRGALSDQDDLECVDTMELAVERCRVIVSQLLTFSRQVPTPPEPLEVASLCREALSLSGVKAVLEMPDAELAVRGIRHELVGLLVNLATNARDASNEGGEVRIRVKEAADSVAISVLDSGHGVPPEIRDRIFDPFFTTKPVGSGTGLGLYMAYTHALNAGGDLKLVRTGLDGSEFTLWLPRLEKTAAASRNPLDEGQDVPA